MQYYLVCFLFALASADTVNNYDRDGMSITVTDKDSGLSQEWIQKVVDTFFEVYPQEKDAYNPDVTDSVEFVFDPAYTDVAETSGAVITFNPEYFLNHPEDYDSVTHEAFHIVQDGADGPGWVIEGLADYARWQFGVNNDAAGWSLTPYEEGRSYEQSYTVSAAFFKYVEDNYPGTVNGLFDATHNHEYTDDTWNQLTGKSVDDLWNDYANSSEANAAPEMASLVKHPKNIKHH